MEFVRSAERSSEKDFWRVHDVSTSWAYVILWRRRPLRMLKRPSQDSFQPHDQIPSGYVSSWVQTLLKISVNNSVCMEQTFLFLCFISTKLWELGKLKPAKLSSRIWLSSYLLVDDLFFSLLTRECTMSDERVNRGWWAPIRLPVFPRWTGNRSTSNPKQHDQNSKLADFQKERARFFVISVKSCLS